MYKKDARGKTVRVEVQEEDAVLVQVEYIGTRVGNFTVSGSVTKRAYRFGSFTRVQEVDERDLPMILQDPRGFQRLGNSSSVIHRPPRRGQLPNIDTPITAPRPSAAEIAARAATMRQAPPKGVVAEGVSSSESVRPRTQNQRLPRSRDTRGTSKVNPRTLGPSK